MALALAMILLLGGCTRKEPTGEAIEPAPAPAPAKTLYQQGEDLAAQLVEMAGNRDYLSLYTGEEEILNILAQTVEGKDYTTPKAVYSLTISEDAAGKILTAIDRKSVV